MPEKVILQLLTKVMGACKILSIPHFILIDKNKRIRGVYDGLKEAEVERIIKDIRLLQNE